MKHPEEKYNRKQERLLSQLSEEERLFHQRMFNIGNTTYCYHQQVRKTADGIEPTEGDFAEWLEGLPENMRNDMAARGFEQCKTALPFTRYVLEKHDIGMSEWMRTHLSEEDFHFWQSQRDNTDEQP